MENKIIDCAAIAQKIKDEVKERVEGMNYKLICVSNPADAASKSYIKNKRKVCDEVGIEFIEIPLDENSDVDVLYNAFVVETCPILIQLPISNTISQQSKDALLELITPERDIDGFGKDALVDPCTAKGVMRIFDEIDYDLTGKHVCIIGRGKTCAMPLFPMLLKKNCTITMCHSYTQNLKDVTSQCDVIISCVGKPHMITAEYVKEGAVVIDVGINRVDGKLCGDVDFEDVLPKVSKITPVPKGVGLTTVACLMENVVELYEV